LELVPKWIAKVALSSSAPYATINSLIFSYIPDMSLNPYGSLVLYGK
jgi:hypothetical protein